MPLHTLHTAAWNWPQPERVWPERWTSADAAGAPKNGAGTDGLTSAFLPWGSACPSTSVSQVQVSFVGICPYKSLKKLDLCQQASSRVCRIAVQLV